MQRIWFWILYFFSALFFVVATYSLVMLLVSPISMHVMYIYRAIAGYFLFVVLYVIASSRRKRYKKGKLNK